MCSSSIIYAFDRVYFIFLFIFSAIIKRGNGQLFDYPGNVSYFNALLQDILCRFYQRVNFIFLSALKDSSATCLKKNSEQNISI